MYNTVAQGSGIFIDFFFCSFFNCIFVFNIKMSTAYGVDMIITFDEVGT
jgi:hypothetical protein